MSTDILRGTGSLRTSDDKEVVTTITYQLWEKSPTEHAPGGEWWGSLTVDHLIGSGEYIIEVEDGRKGACFIRANIQRVRGLGTIYRYSFQGKDSLV